MMKIKIGNRYIGDNHACFIIAEAGSNHDRNFKKALKLIDIAALSGADAVKFQVFKAKSLYSRKTPSMSYLKKEKLLKKGETVFDLLKSLEMPRLWLKDLSQYCKQKKIIFLATPFDLEAVEELEKINVAAYKIASFEITHFPLLESVGKTGKPIILSTGMADLEDIQTALKVIYKTGNKKVVLLHCAINYPPKYEDLNLRAMDTMRNKFCLPVGFSDHTLGITSDIASVARGASIIEKHFTLSRKASGPDHHFALEPPELKAMVDAIHDTEKSLGSGLKVHTKAEDEMYKLGRRSLVAACRIPKGAAIARKMLEVKRPGYGIPVKMMGELIGRIALVDIGEDDILNWKMFK